VIAVRVRIEQGYRIVAVADCNEFSSSSTAVLGIHSDKQYVKRYRTEAVADCNQ
jgi:hypothetical protein